MKKLIVFVTIIFALLIFKHDSVFAQTANNSSLTVEIGESSSKLTYALNYSDYVSKQIIEKITVKFPFSELNNLVIKSGNTQIPFSLSHEDGYQIIKILVSQSNIDFQNYPQVNINFETTEIVKSYPAGNYLFIPQFLSDFIPQTLQFNIVYPASFSSPSEVFLKDYQEQGNSIFGQSDGNILIFWQNKTDFNFEINITSKSNSDEFLFNLPTEDNYKINYIQNPQFKYGLIDKIGNKYGVVDLNENLNTILNIKLNGTIDKLTAGNAVFTNQDFQEIKLESIPELSSINNLQTNLEKLEMLNTYVVNKLSPLSIEKTDLNALSDLQKRIESNSKLTSFEYCYYLSSLASSASINSRIVYGYLYFNQIENLFSPHVWCEHQIDNIIVISDPWMEDLYKVNVLGKKAFDRLKYGYWQKADNINTLLGLTSLNSDILIAKLIQEVKPLAKIDSEFYVTFPANIISLEPNQIELSIKQNNIFENIQSLQINNSNVNYSFGAFTFALAPNSLNKLNLNYNPGFYFVLTPSTKFETTLTTASQTLKTENYATIIPSNNFAVISVIIAILIILLIFLGYKSSLSKRINLYFITIFNKKHKE